MEVRALNFIFFISMAVTADQALAAAKPQKCSLQVLTKAKAMEKDTVGHKNLIPVGFSPNGEEFVFLRKTANCSCGDKAKLKDCWIYSYNDQETVPCEPDGIDEIVSQNLKTDQKKTLQKAKDPAHPVSCEEALRIIKEQKISVSAPEIKSFPASIRGDRYKASVRIIQKEVYEGDRTNYGGEETHQIIFSSSKGEKKIGEFKNYSGWNSALISEVKGYFEVPGSDRILVATSVVGRVFEEETIETIHFWGASLKAGFTQPSPRQKK